MRRRNLPYSDSNRVSEQEQTPASARQLPVNVEVMPDKVVITTHLPGFTGEEVDVQATGDTVVIQTTRQPGQSTARQRVMHEIFEGNWYRRIDLPTQVRPDLASVTFTNGVLTIDLPRANPARKLTLNLPGAETLDQKEIPMRSSADVMPPGPGPHTSVFRP
jgi:HSP20 family protein